MLFDIYINAKTSRSFFQELAKSGLNDIVNNKTKVEILPITMRKKALYERSCKEQVEKMMLNHEHENQILYDSEKIYHLLSFTPIVMRKLFTYSRQDDS